MKFRNKFIAFLASLGVSLVVVGSAASQAAGSASFALSSGTENIGTTFAMNVSVNGGGSQLNVVTANLSYNPSMLQFLSASCGGSFSNTVSASGSGGGVSLSCYTAPGTTVASGTVGTVSFKALGGSGSTAVTVASSSIIASNGSNVWSGSASGGTYALTTPVSTSPSAPASSASSSAGTGSGSTGSSTKTGSSNSGKPSGSSSHSSTGNTGSNGGGSNSSSSNKTTAPPSTSNKSGNNNHSSHNFHGRLVSNASGLSAAAYTMIGIACAVVLAAGLIFRNKLLSTVKVVATKYSLPRRK